MKNKAMNDNLRALCEGAVMVALAVVLNFFKIDIFPEGGSINLLFIPLMVFALRRGAKWGLAAGLVFGVLKGLIGGGTAYGWQSMLLDYIAAYTLVGLTGLAPKKPVAATALGAAGTLTSFVLAGALVWGEYMPEAFLGLRMVNIWVYSLLYNGIPTALNWLIAAVVIGLLAAKTKLLDRQES